MPQEKREVKYKDETFYHEGVIAYREQDWGNGKHYTPNAGFRRDICATIKTYEDLNLWTGLLANWGYWRDGKYHKRNPLDIKGLLTCLEFKQRESQRQKDEDRKRREAVREGDRERVSVRHSDSPMFTLSRTADGWTR